MPSATVRRGKGNDQVRFELGYLAHEPRHARSSHRGVNDMTSRTAVMAFARKHGIKVPTTTNSTDSNLSHISYEGGVLEDPWAAAPEKGHLHAHGFTAQRARHTPKRRPMVEAGPGGRQRPPAFTADVSGGTQPLGRRHGIGRIDIVENHFVGMKSRGVYETPGRTVLQWPTWRCNRLRWIAR